MEGKRGRGGGGVTVSKGSAGSSTIASKDEVVVAVNDLLGRKVDGEVDLSGKNVGGLNSCDKINKQIKAIFNFVPSVAEKAQQLIDIQLGYLNRSILLTFRIVLGP